ncbi:dTDP-4-amino-4,6-dideoxygalactose transaminase [Methylibium rhizosphaerae]|uniref:dTDP-4-amino-4,6-dideoxygalactose transaminase n=1 Tax=Methylibium rhizosphaerae TaxID=2570323 RepID=UPI001C61409A|nr:dTDP-4-amino-4,6-dideoxygalactose transaminase [Methylibium rhizosphaerae]
MSTTHTQQPIIIPFNKPYLEGREMGYIRDAIATGKISGDGAFTKKCHAYFESRYGFARVLLTTSCTDALEMAALLLDIREGDEVIVPAFTFVSTANAFALRGAKLVFADSLPDHPNIDPQQVRALVTPRTRAICVVHYAGMACDMDSILEIAAGVGAVVVEDAAQAVDSYYKGRPLGTFGTFSAFSFHETKNVICGEGGMIAINDPKYVPRAEIVREKGTNRSAFFRGEIDKYGWVDVGSSFLPSDVLAAYLWGQLECLDDIQQRRKAISARYRARLDALAKRGYFELPQVPAHATDNGHMFYLVCRSLAERTDLIAALRANGILATFHYLSLHSSPYFTERHDGRALPNSDRFTDCLLRLPLYYELSDEQVDFICGCIEAFFRTREL